jgi:metal-responsive CopG/Arc/MetJ family transcriptional regulator
MELRMAKENLSVSLSPKLRSLVDREAKRGKRSRSAVVNDALRLYFRLRQIGEEQPTDDERAAVIKGKRAFERGEVVTLDEWRHAVGLGNH